MMKTNVSTSTATRNRNVHTLDPAPLPASEGTTARFAVSDPDERSTRHSGEIRKLTSLLDVSQALSSPVNLKSAFHRVLEILERYHGTGKSVIALPREDGRRLRLHASIGVRAYPSDSPLGGSLAQQVFDSGRPVVIPRVSREPALAELQARTAEQGRRGPREAGRGIRVPGLEDARGRRGPREAGRGIGAPGLEDARGRRGPRGAGRGIGAPGLEDERGGRGPREAGRGIGAPGLEDDRGRRGPGGAGQGIGAPGLEDERGRELGAAGLEDERTYICVPVQQSRKCRGVLEVELQFKSDRNYDRTMKFYGVVASMLAQALKMQRFLEADRQRLVDENVRLRDELRERYDFSQILGTSGAMRQVCEQVVKVARTNTTVLIRGESGTGKELIAHAIHYNSLRARKAFIKVSCAALPDTLIESELFGYEKGAFTGAEQRKKGRFELADGGTLLLDEIGDVTLATQVKLLRVLQERELERLGGTESIKVDVRLVAATNKDLEAAVAQGSLRQDLFYRLNVFTIFVPPLRERKSDILLLADHFVEKLATEQAKQIKRISTAAIDALVGYHWPGNVRELQNVIERAVLVCDGQVIHLHHLPPTLQTAEGSGTALSQSFGDAVSSFERDMIEDALKMARGNRARAARFLQATRRVVNYKIKQYQIDWRRYKQQDSERSNGV